MARRLSEPNRYGGTTDHSEEIAELRASAQEALGEVDSINGEGELSDSRLTYVSINLAADLLEAHDQTGISLDDWPFARQFVESFVGPIIPNLV